jgi:uncharacterized membrane protein
MVPDQIVLFSTIILLVPMGYFLLADPAFLLVKLDVPPVTRLLRGMFNAYYLVLAVAGVVATVAFAVDGRWMVALCIGLIAAFAVVARRWFLQRLDAEADARDAGDPNAVRRLRRLHWGGMLCNAVQVTAFVGCIPYMAAPI